MPVRRHQRIVHGLVVVLASCVIPTAGANTPATPEQLLCAYDDFVEATVVSATKLSCRANATDGHCIQPAWYDATRAVIRVARVLAVKPSQRTSAALVDPGAVYPVTIGYVPLSPARAVVEQALVGRLIREGRPVVGNEQMEWIAQSNLADYFIGHRFLFSLSGSGNAATPGFGAKVWLLSDEPWILKTLTARDGSACARPI